MRVSTGLGLVFHVIQNGPALSLELPSLPCRYLIRKRLSRPLVKRLAGSHVTARETRQKTSTWINGYGMKRATHLNQKLIPTPLAMAIIVTATHWDGTSVEE